MGVPSVAVSYSKYRRLVTVLAVLPLCSTIEVRFVVAPFCAAYFWRGGDTKGRYVAPWLVFIPGVSQDISDSNISPAVLGWWDIEPPPIPEAN